MLFRVDPRFDFARHMKLHFELAVLNSRVSNLLFIR